MTDGLYVAKRHAPHACRFCGGATVPHQVPRRSLAGSRYWVPSDHFGCVMKDSLEHMYDGDFIRSLVMTKNPLFAMIGKDPAFAGRYFPLPITITPAATYRAGYTLVFGKRP